MRRTGILLRTRIVFGALIAVIAAISALAVEPALRTNDVLKIGSKRFTESYILANFEYITRAQRWLDSQRR